MQVKTFRPLLALTGILLAFGLVLASVAAKPALATTPSPSASSSANSTATSNGSQFKYTSCKTDTEIATFVVCSSGRPTAKIRALFMGDSHMRQYYPSLFVLASKYNWNVTLVSKSGCPIMASKLIPAKAKIRGCDVWNLAREKWLAAQKPFDFMFNSNSTFITRGDPAIVAAVVEAIRQPAAKGTSVLVLFDNPKPRLDISDCYKKYSLAQAAKACQVTRAAALQSVDGVTPGVKGIKNVKTLDLTNLYCNTVCLPVLNGIKVYRDTSHITAPFAATLINKLDAAIPARFKSTGK